MTRREMDYRVQVCGWPRGCFSDDGTQLYTPGELEARALADEAGRCPSGICIAARGDNLTGAQARNLAHAQALEAETAARLEILCKGERSNRQQQPAPEVKELGSGGEWIRVGGAEVQQDAQPAHLSLWALLTGAR